jgi:putative endopeptidase|uniref:Peptidase M13 C-terminal domain-containing protein n=1 Tax=viral metagenome TaxID=1070528 RepID=A0A6C0CK01_9ZZZZ
MKKSIKKVSQIKRIKTHKKAKKRKINPLVIYTNKDNKMSKKETSKELEIKSEEIRFPLKNRKINPSTAIFKMAGEKFDNMRVQTNRPILERLFSQKNMELFKSLPSDSKDYSKYHSILVKQFDNLNKNKYSPREDYYTYVNYGWLKEETKLLKSSPKYYVEIDDFRVKQDDVYKELIGQLKEFIKENPNSKRAKGVEAIYKCIMNNTKTAARKAAYDLREDIDSIINNKSITDMLVFLNRDEVVSWQSPVVWYIMPDEKDNQTYRSHLSPPQLGIYDYFVYIEDPKDTPKQKQFKSKFKNEYLKFIKKVLKICIPDEAHLHDPMDVWNVECQLLDAMGCVKVKKEDPNYYNVVTKKQLEEDYGLDWTEFCIKQGYKKDKIPNKIIVSSLNSLKCIMELMKEKWTSKAWRTWYLFINYKQLIRFEWDWSEIYFDFYGKFVAGQPVRFPKELYPIFMLSVCYNTLLTELYVKENFNPIDTVYVYNLVSDLKEVFIRKLKRNTWLTDSTRRAAVKKLMKLEVVIGTPDSASAATKGQALQPDPNLEYIDDNPYHNLRLLSDWKRRRFIDLEGEQVIDIPEVDWNEFKLVGTQAYMVNAYYRPTSNSIYVPLAYLQKPFLDLENYGIEYNLAYMGWTLGHELSHSLDDMGSKFDENGNLNNWWTDVDRKKFQAKIDNVVKQYELVAAKDGIKFDATVGVGEDLADISGLSLVEEYLFIHQLINNQIPLVKALSLKQFYIFSTIQSRQKIFDKAIPAQLKQNPHPLEKYRCNCPLSRLQIFRELYEVKKGDGMWWENTDTIW